MRGLSRQRLVISIALLTLGATLALVLAGPLRDRLEWRGELLTLKLQGELPSWSWGALASTLAPWSHGSSRAVPVREAGTGEQPCPVLWQTPVRSFWGRASDRRALELVLSEQLLFRTYSRGPVVIRPGDTVLDIGAHLGTFTALALREGARTVVAFEPEPVNADCYERTFREEIGAGRVRLVRSAVWDEEGHLELRLKGGLAASVVFHQGGTGSVDVPSTTIDRTVERLSLERVDFIKMDIEGAESHALRGAVATLSRFGPRMVVCTYHHPEDRTLIPRLARDARPAYRVFSRGKEQAYFY